MINAEKSIQTYSHTGKDNIFQSLNIKTNTIEPDLPLDVKITETNHIQISENDTDNVKIEVLTRKVGKSVSHGDDDDGRGNGDENLTNFTAGKPATPLSSVLVNESNGRVPETNVVEHLLRRLWKDQLEQKPSDLLINKYTASTRYDELRVNGTDRPSMQRQMTAQFVAPLIRGNQRALWLDGEFSIFLRGQAVLALQSSQELRRLDISRGLRLSCPSGSASLLKCTTRALAHSLSADFLLLSRRSIDAVRKAAEQRLSTTRNYFPAETLLKALFDGLHASARPCIICLHEELDWLSRVPGVPQIITDELSKQRSKLFFLHVEPDSALSESYSPGDYKNKQSVEPTQTAPDSNFRGFPTNSFRSLSDMDSPLSDASMNPMMPGLSNAKMPMPIQQSFQISISKNGSATMQPIPSMFPPGYVPGMAMPSFPGMSPNMPLPPGMITTRLPGGSIPSPPEQLMRQVVELHQKRQAEGSLGPMAFTEEDMKQFMEDPENKAVMKEFLDSVVKAASSQIPPGMLESAQPDSKMEINVHMLTMPVPRQVSLPETLPSASQVDKMAESKSSSFGARKSIFPGLFAKSKNAKSSSKVKSSDMTKPPVGINSTNISTSVEPRSIGSKDSDTRQSVEQAKSYKDSLMSLLPEVTLAAPRDQALRVLWDRMVEDEFGKKVIKINRRQIEKECKRRGIHLRLLNTSSINASATSKTVAHSAALTDILSRRVMSGNEISHAIHSAKLMQAGMGHGTKDIRTVGLWALDAGLCGALGFPLPKLGRAVTKPLDELFASIVDKHERALIPNVVSPSEVGVTYDMIGGLADVKEALQQSITYPLKHPRLYKEGLAAEGVKGVLLFGPPGTG